MLALSRLRSINAPSGDRKRRLRRLKDRMTENGRNNAEGGKRRRFK
jgi:hypothetical protein